MKNLTETKNSLEAIDLEYIFEVKYIANIFFEIYYLNKKIYLSILLIYIFIPYS